MVTTYDENPELASDQLAALLAAGLVVGQLHTMRRNMDASEPGEDDEKFAAIASGMERLALRLLGDADVGDPQRYMEEWQASQMVPVGGVGSIMCAHCGHEAIGDTQEVVDAAIKDHMAKCPNHPMRALERENARLREELAALKGGMA